jgi:GAF domain-containing protein
VFGPDQRLLAVLDIDSDKPATFDEVDRVALERLMSWFERR